MKGKDTLIILIAVALMIITLSGAALLMPAINRQRQALQLTANDQMMQNLPPDIALTQAALGSFRGLAVDILWARAEKMKQDGQFWEASQLADIITKLQPRFPQVWQFHAWNMAYNISVATHTPQERWKWVSDGINLLRDEGIPLNPNSVLLYKELSWIFLHKIGQFSDDMHWYYKPQLALEWHRLLGAPVAGTTQQVIDQFAPIAEAYEKYVNQHELDQAIREEFERLLKVNAGNDTVIDAVWPLRDLTIEQFDVQLDQVIADLRAKSPELAARLDKLRALTTAQRRKVYADPIDRLLADDPAAKKALDELNAMGLKPDHDLLMRIANQAMDTSADLKLLGAKLPEDKTPLTLKLQRWLDDPSIAPQREKIIAFARAKALTQMYHMDPMWMLELMQGKWFVERGEKPTPIPLDWRHPAAHGLYWAALGVRRSGGLLQRGDYDLLNTDRQVLHALQALTHTGYLSFDPVSMEYEQLPDVRYIEAYDHAVYGANERIFSDRLKHSGAPDSFQAGHENFLIWSVQQLYVAGNTAEAEKYYKQLREKYTSRGPERVALYQKPLNEFVIDTFVKEDSVTSLDDARGLIAGFIGQAIDQGMALRQPQRARQFMDIAKVAYEKYQKKQDYKTEGAEVIGRNRMALPPFDDIVMDVFMRYMLTPRISPDAVLIKARVWESAPLDWKQRAYDRIRDPLYDQVRKVGLNPEIAVPEPEGMAAYRAAHPTKTAPVTPGAK
ncbi:MAG: hypothetical protein GC162_20845 [Planctomycetes bacterium]|nr:hypothetical protein [Planctomycetota bacterium]